MRRSKIACILISPHQDDEFLGCAHSFRKLRNSSNVIITVTKSMWKDLTRYGIRQIENSNSSYFLGSGLQELGLREEDLFTVPYLPENYIGESMIFEWSDVLLSFLESYTAHFTKVFFFYPSVEDAMGHVVHDFTRKITLNALNGLPELNYTKLVYSVYAEPITAKRVICDFDFKFEQFKAIYPSQWDVIKLDQWSRDQIKKHCKYEYIEVSN